MYDQRDSTEDERKSRASIGRRARTGVYPLLRHRVQYRESGAHSAPSAAA